ncbi:WAP four-disulfide core domain protein 3-like [Aythya fuligula]|uniref:WAP four-disulfide core domain protein 3-like n=1 Tax=Aythya fuligula TaxID=219594 RepID=A0A6J3DX17_AYTFU|nr:WAP four-disulfide core domain protein 3-like [Aythya fuligula]
MKPGSLLSLLSLVLLVALLAPPGECRLDSELVLAGKFGDCPAPRKTPNSDCGNFCSTDDNCPGSELCCSNGCGKECTMPIGAKAGFCPRVDSNLITICLVDCARDSDCAGNEKCCSMGCHVRCARPVRAKPGVCPKRRLRYTLLPCNSTCRDDTDCPGRQKCCFTGCSLGCMAPDRRKGYSPAATLLGWGWGWGCRQCPALIASPVLQSDVCHLPPEHGPCRGLFYRYAYDPATGTCRLFLYGGCRGNANNFETLGECQRVCQRGRAKE